MEITGRCQLECRHCYAESGPGGTHGAMTTTDWVRVLDQAAELGVEMVQFIGGEPTLHPDLPRLVRHALGRGLAVEVFSNLVHVTEPLWEVFSEPGVSVATSYYSDDPARHAAITGRPSYARTRANIAEAVWRGIPLRAGVIDLDDGQRAEQAQAELAVLGVSEIGYDRLRQVGRGVRDQHASVEQLCGRCGDGVAAISPDGAVWPCVFSRWLPAGSVLDAELAAVLTGAEATRIRGELAAVFAGRGDRPAGARPCYPDCNPACQPNCAPRCGPMCNPRSCRPNSCWPQYRGGR
ncbi:radical SAM/SPASM domain-containing protein [Amycolatopsis arida]|uniref:radical SAM/SPASM domain-containing protein n=1 Tax=Amycolatopsis arida TaxID=587909 RepID=UPI0010647CCC|nr:radical SAM protein [Amycolatopsis arida]